MRIRIALLAAALTATSLLGAGVSPARADAATAHLSHARTLATWKAPAFAESMAPFGHDAYLVSVTAWGKPDVGRLWRVDADGGRTAFGPTLPLGPCSMLLGVTTVDDDAYVAVYDFEGADCSGRSMASGVLRVTATGYSRVATLPAGSWPNGLVARHDRLYVTDSAAGAVWRLPLTGPSAPRHPWFTSALLKGTAQNPIGANGIVYADHALYVASSAKGLVVKLALDRDGGVASAKVLARDSRLVTVDGLALDGHGRIWATVNTGSVVRVGRGGDVVPVVVPAGTLDYPTQLLLSHDGRVVVTNGSFDKAAPSVVAFDR